MIISVTVIIVCFSCLLITSYSLEDIGALLVTGAAGLANDDTFFVAQEGEVMNKGEIIAKNQNMAFGHFVGRYRKIDKENVWLKKYFNNENVFLYALDFSSGQGNTMGMYFAALSCAKIIGAHFVAIPQPHSQFSPDKYVASFPLIIQHPNPIPREQSVRKMQVDGNCDSNFPWQDAHSGIYQNIDEVKTLIKNSIKILKDYTYGPQADRNTMMTNFSSFELSNYFINENYNHAAFLAHPNNGVDNKGVEQKKEKPNALRPQRKDDISRIILENRNETKREEEFLNHFKKKTPNDEQVPVLPDAAISIRCIDVLAGHTEQYSPYGFLNFNIYKQIIPSDATTIYIFTEPHTSHNKDIREEICSDIILSLVLFLDLNYPSALIAVKRAHQTEAVVAFSNAPIVICPPSTFCIWPAMVNINKVHFAISSLLMSHKPLYIEDNWNWIAYPHIHQFGHLPFQNMQRSSYAYTKQISKILAILMSEGPFVSSLEDREKLSMITT